MVELQRFTGMRSGEVCRMRGCDLNTAATVWTYTPARHKTAFRGHSRVVYLGPRAQAIVRPWLRTDLESYLFSPIEAEPWRRQQRHAARKTKLSYGNSPGTNRKRRPKKRPGEYYTTSSYLRAIKYARGKCNEERKKNEQTEIPSWHPHQLRHSHATMVKREHGLEVARVLLGHKHASMTEVYAEVDRERAVEVVARIG
jgi:integrase